MNKKKWAATLTVLLTLLVLITSAVQGQSYLFNLQRYEVDFAINPDGSATLIYIFDFQNDPAGHAIEYVDVGLPNNSYDLGSVSATVDGQPITDIERADPDNLAGTSFGVTLGLGANSIPPGSSGRVELTVGRIERMVFPGDDPNRPDYAGFQFWTNYFGSEFVTGDTEMIVTLRLPPGVEPDQAVYYTPGNNWPGEESPESGYDDQDRVFYTWTTDQADAGTQYAFGAGFPASFVPASAITTPPTSSGQGFDAGMLICLGVGCLFAVVFIWGLVASIRGAGKRKLAYLPPRIAIEGHGIKRGLTAVEAGILQELPLDKVLTIILFSVVKKGAATVKTREPLELDATVPQPEGLQPYEVSFVQAFSLKGAERRKALQDMFVSTVQSVSEKMKGFSRKETQDYYRSIMDQAWAQVEAADTPEVKGQKFDEALEWTMLDRRFEDRTRETFRGGPVFVPVWWGGYDPTYRGGIGGTRPSTPTISTPNTPSAGRMSTPNLPGSDFAASVVNGVQSFGAGVIGDVTSFTSGVTNKTNPVPKTTTSSTRSGGGGGGRSCACACACAGCACACAGGGR